MEKLYADLSMLRQIEWKLVDMELSAWRVYDDKCTEIHIKLLGLICRKIIIICARIADENREVTTDLHRKDQMDINGVLRLLTEGEQDLVRISIILNDLKSVCIICLFGKVCQRLKNTIN